MEAALFLSSPGREEVGDSIPSWTEIALGVPTPCTEPKPWRVWLKSEIQSPGAHRLLLLSARYCPFHRYPLPFPGNLGHHDFTDEETEDQESETFCGWSGKCITEKSNPEF
jgi:hypothetical protein